MNRQQHCRWRPSAGGADQRDGLMAQAEALGIDPAEFWKETQLMVPGPAGLRAS